jgi:hypothetical protein
MMNGIAATMKMTIKHRIPSATNKIRSEPALDFPRLRHNLRAAMLGTTITAKGKRAWV